MMKKKIVIISCVVLLTISMLMLFNKRTFSVDGYQYVFESTKKVNLNKSDIQKLIVRTAMAFYNNKEYIHYKSGEISRIGDSVYSYSDLTVSPEDLNGNKMVYMNDSSFIFSVYINALKLNLSEGLEKPIDLNSGVGFETEDILEIIAKDDDRLVFESDEFSRDDQVLFAAKYISKLEPGDIIVYTENNITHVALYIGIDGEENHRCIYMFENVDNAGMYIHNVDDYLFPNNRFISEETYYAIVRPLNNLNFDSIDRIALDVPVNSLARVDDVYVKRYTDVGTGNVYRGETINYTIEVSNRSDSSVVIKSVSDVLHSYLLFIDSDDGKYDISNKTIVWNNVSLAAGETCKFTYTVKVVGEDEIDGVVGNESVYGKEIIANNAKVLINGDNYLTLNTIKFEIANKYIDEQVKDLQMVVEQVKKIDDSLLYGSSDGDYKTKISEITNGKTIKLNDLSFYSFLYYNAFGIDFEVMNEEIIKNNLFLLGEDNYYVRNTLNDELSVKVNKMVVDNLYGGYLLNDNGKNKIFSPIVNNEYSYSNLVSGDIIVYWDEDGIQNSYLYVEFNDNNQVKPLLINYSDLGVLTFDDVYERIDKRVLNSALYVVLRPSKILDIKLEDLEMEPINIKVDSEKQIMFVKKPVNATIREILYSISDKFEINEKNNTIKGLISGSDTLKLTINGEIKKDVNVVVFKDIYDFKIITNYRIDKVNDNKIMYVENDVNVETILGNIQFNNNGYDKKIFNLSHEEIVDKITEKAILEVSLNGELIEQYMIISFSLNSRNNEEIISNEKIIRYVNIDTKVSDMKKMLLFNGNDIGVQFTDIDGNVKSDNDKLATGDYLLFNVTDNLQEKYQISVSGDISGNGVFNGNDVVLTRRHIVGWIDPKTSLVYELDGVFVYAMDYSMNGIVNGNDVSAMRRKLVN